MLSQVSYKHVTSATVTKVPNPRFMLESSILFESFSIFFLGHVVLAFLLTNIAYVI